MTIIPHRIPSLLPKMFPGLVWQVAVGIEKIIYLTFDDGPVPGPTEFVLDTLEKFQAKATFFCIGDNVRKFPGVFNKIVESGHAIGNHTFNHVKGWSTPIEKYLENVKLCDKQLSTANGQLSNLFRPPYGRITFKQIKALKDYRIIMWDILSHDYLQDGSGEIFLKGIIEAARPGSIVVFHDSLKAEKNMQYMLPRFLNHFSELGFSFKAL